MDVTHISEFGKLSHVHVTVDTFSHVIVASARTGEAYKVVIKISVPGLTFLILQEFLIIHKDKL